MKKYILALLVAFFVFQGATFAQNETKKTTKHKIEFTTKDNYILVGDLYIADKVSTKPLVILLHSFSLNSSVWVDTAQNLRAKGYNVLAMDIRGHGRSVYNEDMKLKSRFKFSQKEWAKLPTDVLQSIDYIKTHYTKINCKDLIIVGADIGASAGILAGEKTNPQPKKFVLISPQLNFKGLYLPVKTANLINSDFLILVSSADKTSIENTEKLTRFIQKTPQVKYYPLGGAGNQLLKVNSNAKEDIINFIIN